MVKAIPFLLDKGSFLNDQIMISEAREDSNAKGLASAGELDSISDSPNATEYLEAEMRISRDAAFKAANTSVKNYLQVFSQAMDSLYQVADQLRSTMTTALTDGNGITQSEYNNTIDRLMKTLQDTLLTKYNDRMYVFSGDNTSRPPVGDLTALPHPATGSGPDNSYYLHRDNDAYRHHQVSDIDNRTLALTGNNIYIQALVYSVNLARGVNISDPAKVRGLEVLKHAEASTKDIPVAGRPINELIKTLTETNEKLDAAQNRDEAVAKEAGFVSMETRYMEMFKNRTLAKVGREIAAMSTRDIMELAKAISQP